MHISKYTFNGFVGKVIHGRDILIGIVARIENTLSFPDFTRHFFVL